MNTIDGDLKSLRDNPPQQVVDLEPLGQEVKEARDASAVAMGALATAKQAAENSICPSCQRPYDLESGVTQEQLIQAAAEAEKDHREKMQKFSKLEAMLTHNLEVNKQAAKYREDVENTEAARSQAMDELAAAKSAVEDHEYSPLPDPSARRGRVDALLDEWQVAHRIASAHSASAQTVYSLKEELASIQKELDSLPEAPEVPPGQIQAARELVDTRQHDEYTISTELATLKERYAAHYREYTAESQLHAQRVKQDEEQKEDRKRLHGLADLRKYLTKNRDTFTEKVWGSLLAYSSQFVEQATGGAVTAVSRDDKGNFTYQEDGEIMPIQAASGLQKAIIGTSVRLALAEAVRSSSSFFLLDEVTAGAADDASMAVTNALSQTGLQIIAITHRQADAAVADRVVEL